MVKHTDYGYHGGEEFYYTHKYTKGGHGMPCGDIGNLRGGQEAERAGEYMDRTSVVVSMGRDR